MDHPLRRIKELIEDRDVTQKKLAKLFHITESTMSGYMTGRIRLPAWLVGACAQYFEVSADYLYGFSDEPQPPMRLSPEEQALVTGYRALSREQRELIVQSIRLMLEQNRR